MTIFLRITAGVNTTRRQQVVLQHPGNVVSSSFLRLPGSSE